MSVIRISPLRIAIAVVVVATCTLVIIETGTSHVEDQESIARNQRLQELTLKLAEKHDYKLTKDEPFKYIASADSEMRSAIRYVLMNTKNWSEPPNEFVFAPFTLVFHANGEGRFVQTTAQEGVVTLADVFENILGLMPQEYECPTGLLTTYVPGDWILSWNPNREEHLSKLQLATLERILNEQLNLRVRISWKVLERPALVIQGTYRAKPNQPKIKLKNETVASQSDGMFVVHARRAACQHPSIMGDDFERFTQIIGSLLMLPVVLETDSRPAKTTAMITWNEVGNSIVGRNRLEPEHEQRVLDSLHEQLGYDLTIEPREVRLLSIQPMSE